MTRKVRPLGTSVTSYLVPAAFPSGWKTALVPDVTLKLMLSGSRTLLEVSASPVTAIAVPAQLVDLNCSVLVVWATQTGAFVLIASCRPSLRYALTARAPAWTRALRR